MKTAGQLHEYSYGQPPVQYPCVLGCRQDLHPAETPRAKSSNRSAADSSAAFVPTPRTDVSGARSHLSRHPSAFAYPAALGDLLAAILAVAAIPTVVKDVRGARLLVWIFNVAGTLDLVAAITLATVYGASMYMGPAYWIPAFWVPALLVTHYITFIVLRKYWTAAA